MGKIWNESYENWEKKIEEIWTEPIFQPYLPRFLYLGKKLTNFQYEKSIYLFSHYLIDSLELLEIFAGKDLSAIESKKILYRQ